jgi:hypothetical protein
MEGPVGRLKLANLVLEGAVIAVAVELVCRCLFVNRNQKSWIVRGLKIIMAVAMIIKSAIFSAFSTKYATIINNMKTKN